jgi:hypothetical protein
VQKIKIEWYELVSLDDHGTDEILAFSRKWFNQRWKKRFEEDLVELLSRMGHPPQRNVKLVLKPRNAETTCTFERVPMTEENRRAIYRAAMSR